jgi:hypothetical protein
MRDRALELALRRLAAEAATRFASLVATGEEIPFDVAEDSGEHTFYRYVPLTSRFVGDHEDELRSLPSFEPACAAVSAAGVAAPYLEARECLVAEDEDRRSASMLIAFLSRLWQGSAEFTLDRARLEAALHELDTEAMEVSEAERLIAPLVGLQMPLSRLELPSGVLIARADTVETPGEAMRSEGMQRSPWEPQFVALAELQGGPEGSASAMRMLRELISVMRLFKEGGIGLGPYVFAPTGEDRWRRIATGVPATRPGGYKLSEAEAAELADLACRLEARPDPDASLAWAVARFEMGCDRLTALDGVSDHLLALRALFEGRGPVGAALPMRVAALISRPAEREEACEKVQAAFELERALMAGHQLDVGSAIGLAAWLEDGARAIVREAALGMHGGEVGAAADEALITAGMEAGEGSPDQMGATSEWDAIPVPEYQPEEVEAAQAVPAVEEDETQEISVFRTNHDEELWDDLPDGPQDDEEAPMTQTGERDWLAEVSREERVETLEWPAPSDDTPRRDERIDTPRVRHLFPVPEETDWEVGELDYDRDRARVG